MGKRRKGQAAGSRCLEQQFCHLATDRDQPNPVLSQTDLVITHVLP